MPGYNPIWKFPDGCILVGTIAVVDAMAAGACLHAKKSVRIIQGISPEPVFRNFQ